MTGFNAKIDGQQSVDIETQTATEVTNIVDQASQTDNIVKQAVMRYIGTNVDTGEKEYEMIC